MSGFAQGMKNEGMPESGRQFSYGMVGDYPGGPNEGKVKSQYGYKSPYGDKMDVAAAPQQITIGGATSSSLDADQKKAAAAALAARGQQSTILTGNTLGTAVTGKRGLLGA